MKPDRRPFMPVSNDIDDDQLERLAREKGVGKLEAPMRPASRAGEAAPPPPATPEPDSELRNSGATPRSKMQKVNFEAPDYLSTELKIDAAEKNTSVRHVIMLALKKAGFTIMDIDMIEDGRRLRGSNKLH
jgi:hypothetical protein